MDSCDELNDYYEDEPATYVKKPTLVQDMAQRFEEASIGADLRNDPDFKDDFKDDIKSKTSSYEEVWSEEMEEEEIYLDQNYDEPTPSER